MKKSGRLQEEFQSAAEGDNSLTPAKRKAILVLGMHRSGTSALGGVLNALGAAAPKTLMVPYADNPRGFFESAVLADAHDALLASAGSCWQDWRQFNHSSIVSSAAEEHRQKIKALLVDEFGDAPLILVKDPRICRFIPFTLSILNDMDIDPVAILPLRNPLEVAYSLKRRNGFALAKSMLLWLRHVLEAEHRSRHLPRYFLSYEKFLTDWRNQIKRAAEKTGIEWPVHSALSDTKVEQFLTLDLHRERASLDEVRAHPEVMSLVRETYGILTKIVESGENGEMLDQLDRVRTTFNEGCQMFGAVVAAEEAAAVLLQAELHHRIAVEQQLNREKLDITAVSEQRLLEVHRLTAEHASLAAAHGVLIAERDGLATAKGELAAVAERLATERESLVAANNELRAAQEAVLASRSWKLTAPLRSLRELLSGRRD